jgi:hypothetical protein
VHEKTIKVAKFSLFGMSVKSNTVILEVSFLVSSVTLALTFNEQNYFLMTNAEFGLNIMFLLANIICVFWKYLSIKMKNKSIPKVR